ncbi:aspartate racemase/maleate isomerase family protein, partial [Acidiplasma cupricumulans]
MIRVGMIVPANNVALEYDMYHMAPSIISFHSTRMRPSRGCEPQDPEKFRRELGEAYNLIKKISDVTVYGRTYGTHKNIEIIKTVIKKNLIIPEVSVMNLLRYKKINNVWLGTPYIKERTAEEANYFKSNNFNITGFAGLNKIYGLDISNTGDDEIIKMIENEKSSVMAADAIYLSCTALPTHSVINKVMKKFNMMVISENSAILWEISRIFNINFEIPGIS